jgi:hypothetical protein
MNEEPTYAREYIHVASAGNGPECEIIAEKVENPISGWYDEKQIQGYDLMTLRNDQECEEELVHDDWKQIVGNVFPVLYLLIQPFQPPAGLDPQIEAYLTQAGFVRVR